MINIADFLSFVSVKKGLSKNSQKHCRIRANILNQYLEENEKELSKQSIEEFFYYLQKDRQINNNSLNTYYFVVRHLQDYLKDRGDTIDILGNLKSFKKSKPLITILTVEEIEQLLNTAVSYGTFRGKNPSVSLNSNLGALTMFLAHTGCRFNEAAMLKCKYLDIAGKVATFIETKNKEFRRVFLDDELISKLKELVLTKGDEDLVFNNSAGKYVNPQDYALYLAKLKEKCGIKKRIHPHIFRHSFATQLLMSGADVTYVAKLLGHKDIQTTYNSYVHLADQALRQAQFMHPLLRQGMKPQEIIKQIKEAIMKCGIDDKRFRYEITDKGIELLFRIEYLESKN